MNTLDIIDAYEGDASCKQELKTAYLKAKSRAFKTWLFISTTLTLITYIAFTLTHWLSISGIAVGLFIWCIFMALLLPGILCFGFVPILVNKYTPSIVVIKHCGYSGKIFRK